LMGAARALFAVLWSMSALGACEGGRDYNAAQANMDYAAREPGSDAAPSTELSFQLLGYDGPSRFESMRRIITDARDPCSAVKKAVFKSGLDGTDEWWVSCADSGIWDVWINPAIPPTVEHCSNSKCSYAKQLP
jgi:hypothetical protein